MGAGKRGKNESNLNAVMTQLMTPVDLAEDLSTVSEGDALNNERLPVSFTRLITQLKQLNDAATKSVVKTNIPFYIYAFVRDGF
jgi:hypothetical protein